MSNKESKPARFSRTFVTISMVFVSTLIIANTVATKVVMVGDFAVAAGIVCFPITYIISDVVTEVYGYRRAKFITWVGFGCLALMSILYLIAAWLPPAPFYQGEAAFDSVFTFVPRIALGSLIGFVVGSLLNAVVLSRLKILTEGRWLWTRTIGSTIVGEAADSVVFAVVAFAGIFEMRQLIILAFTGFALKTLYEILATPFTYIVVRRVKSLEGEDTFDHGVRYSPF
jgi:uncharacterized integral membrane protein (TIGR00697 family)